jgi:NAD(P)-dependent dehydrogenase (short-subunit alcohol dehydrogenase family)
MPTILISGASRGIGLELARQYAAEGWRVIACCREPGQAQALSELAGTSVEIRALDVTDPAQIASLSSELAEVPIDVLLNCAGTMGEKSFAEAGLAMQRFGDSDYADWEQILRVNALGPMRMAEAFVEHVARSEQKKIVTLTSVMGSMGANGVGGLYAYRSSKAAANSVMKSMSINLRDRGIIALPMHPGWVRTEMGGPKADIDAVTSASGLRRVIAGLTPADSGRFLAYSGEELPW